MISFRAFRRELRSTVRLALPLVLAEIGWMSMGIVDTIRRERKIPTLKNRGWALAIETGIG